MPIPPFDSIYNVLPPRLGDPTEPSDLSPYARNLSEVCGRFNTTATRRGILNGFLDLRRVLLQLGVRGFQWASGSFVEDIESQEGRDPRDVDVSTFVDSPRSPVVLDNVLSRAGRLDLYDPSNSSAA